MSTLTTDTRTGTHTRHDAHEGKDHDESGSHGGSYLKFFAMIGTSTALMLGLMFLNTYRIEHLFWSETRFYMTFVMGATMAVVMLAFMLGMYRNRMANIAIFAGSVVVFAVALWLVRSQETVQDRSFMSAMIPHHSIAIMTSTRSELSDPRVQQIASEIAAAQDREISEMRYMIADIAANGEAPADFPLGKAEGPAPEGSVAEALSRPVIAHLSPEPVSAEEAERTLGAAPQCTFRRSETRDPVFSVAASGDAVMKISGTLVTLSGTATQTPEGSWDTEGARMTVTPGIDGWEHLIFELTGDQPLQVGMAGIWACS